MPKRVNPKIFTVIYFGVGAPTAMLLNRHYDAFVAIGFLFLWAFTIYGMEAGINA